MKAPFCARWSINFRVVGRLLTTVTSGLTVLAQFGETRAVLVVGLLTEDNRYRCGELELGSRNSAY